MSELTDKVAGKAKEVAGAITGDDSMEGKGKAQGLKGNVEGKGNDLKDKAASAFNSATENDAGGHDGDHSGAGRDTV